jgi:hypothetical protein
LLPAQTALRSIAGCFSAAEKVLKVHSRTKEQTMFLMSLLDALEKVSPTELLALAS